MRGDKLGTDRRENAVAEYSWPEDLRASVDRADMDMVAGNSRTYPYDADDAADGEMDAAVVHVDAVDMAHFSMADWRMPSY